MERTPKVNLTPNKPYSQRIPLSCPKPIPEALPHPEWQRMFCSSFIDLRQERAKPTNLSLPHINDKQSWFEICYGKKYGGPTYNLVMSLDNITVSGLVAYFSEWIEEEFCLTQPLDSTSKSTEKDEFQVEDESSHPNQTSPQFDIPERQTEEKAESQIQRHVEPDEAVVSTQSTGGHSVFNY
eukprot:TRINITY_DN953_c0_g2_i19.p1 TRINITY_DN953_c0_g2~~TRINITY_DN953_c0_g2_i19.p1  ORF type:complete len:182 (+),score=39.57 TRINITY_DN953_c0_g2_i19:200-745(+)